MAIRKTGKTAKKAIASVKLAKRNVNQGLKLSRSTAKVVAARTDLAKNAMNMAPSETMEFTRMVPEKAVAFGAAGLAFMHYATRIAAQIRTNALAEWDALRTETVTAQHTRSPIAFAIQQGASMRARWERMAARSVELGTSLLQAQYAVMAPIQDAASRNERRLSH